VGRGKHRNNFFGGDIIQKIEGTVSLPPHLTLTSNQIHRNTPKNHNKTTQFKIKPYPHALEGKNETIKNFTCQNYI
jgi:hypothetical protein